MNYRKLGRTGITVSPFGLGALMLGTAIGNDDEADAIRIVHRALDAGINLIDTADAYTGSEELVGKALKGRRDGVVLATKFGRPQGEDPNRRGGSRRWIVSAVEASLKRLQTDHIDLYQLHFPDPETDVEETLSALSDLIHSGKVRAIGASHSSAAAIVEAQWVAERRGLAPFRSEQPPYSLLNRGIERDILPTAQRYGLGVIAWGPLGQGMLTGRVHRDKPNELRRAGIFRHLNDTQRIDAAERFAALAAELGVPLVQLAMAFTIAHPAVSSALLGPRTEAQLDGLLAGLELSLSDELLDRIDAIVAPGTEVGVLDQAYVPAALTTPGLRRRPLGERAAA